MLVVGDDRTLRVHVHTDEPDRAVALFESVGEVSRFDVADMHEQVAERSARLAGEGAATEPATCAVVAVASGPGVKRLYEELGVLVVDGGATMNPSTYELLAGIHAAPGAEVLVLPNSPNVILAAERAAELSEKPARVVPTTAPQEGLAALLAFDPTQGSDANETVVHKAAEALRLGGVAPAARDDAQGRFTRRRGASGYAGGELVAWGDPAETLAATLAQIADGAELLTCIAGEQPPLDRAAVEARAGRRRGGVPRGRAARVVVAALRGVTARYAFASKRAAARRRRPSAPTRKPSLLAEPIDGPKALERLGIATWGDLIEHLPHAHRDRRDVRLVGELGVGEEATVAVAVRGVTVKPMRDRRRKRVEARVFDESGPLVAVWFNQPWIARQLGEGSQVLLHGKLRRRGEFWVTEFEQLGGDGAPVHTVGLVPVHPATEGISAAQAARADVGGLPAHARLGRAAADRAARGRAAAGPAGGAGRRALPRPRGGRAGRAAPARLRGAVPAPAGGRRAAGAPAARGAARGRSRPRGVVVDRWRWSLPFELTGDQVARDGRDRRRPRPASARCSGC